MEHVVVESIRAWLNHSSRTATTHCPPTVLLPLPAGMLHELLFLPANLPKVLAQRQALQLPCGHTLPMARLHQRVTLHLAADLALPEFLLHVALHSPLLGRIFNGWFCSCWGQLNIPLHSPFLGRIFNAWFCSFWGQLNIPLHSPFLGRVPYKTAPTPSFVPNIGTAGYAGTDNATEIFQKAKVLSSTSRMTMA